MENPRIDFEEEMYDQCDHSYQDGFNSGYKQGQIDTIKRFCNITPQKTNADRIRAMTDEELAAFLTDDFCKLVSCESPCDGQCDRRMLEWLKQIDLHGTDEGGDILYDECGNVIDYGIVGPPGEPGVKKEVTDGT